MKSLNYWFSAFLAFSGGTLYIVTDDKFWAMMSGILLGCAYCSVLIILEIKKRHSPTEEDRK